jgi:protein-L-isoaspartate(D-aspartate) O-methyltransferase
MIRVNKRDIYLRARQRMVEAHIVGRGISRKEVVDAFMRVPRHLFVDEALMSQAYGDFALPLGERQSISRPYIVALMTEALCLTGSEKVLEVGSGSGYQSAVLSVLSDRVCSIERIPALASRARRTLDSLHCSNVVIKVGDGTVGWAEEAPFDAIIAAASSPSVPTAYIEQLRDGGTLVMPVGGEDGQELVRVRKWESGPVTEVLGACLFVKLIGRHGWGPG